MDIAELGLEIHSDSVPRATQRLRDFEGQAGRAERSTSALAGAMRAIGPAILSFTAAAFSFSAVIRTLAGFEQSMAAVQAITRANATEMAALRDIAKELGATTEFSASQAADGLRFLGMAGFTATESVAAIPSVLNLATAAAMDLASAADITSNIMSGFGIQAENASAVADVLAAASSRANTNVQQLGSAMSTVAPIAAALDISLADTAAAIGVLSDAGIQGERAGTAMRGVLASLAGPTTQAQKVLANLGLTVQDVNPEANSLATIFGRLREAGLSTADAMTIFGREAASGALVLVDAAERVGEFGTELSGVTGEAQRMADTMRDNLGGDIQGLISSVEAMIIALGEAGLTAALRSVTQIATEAFRFLAEGMERALYYAGAAATFFAGPYVAAFVAARVATFSLTAALTALRGALIRTGIGALIVLAGELVYQFVQLVERTGGVGQAFVKIGQIGAEVWERIQIGAYALDAALGAVADSIMGYFLHAWASIQEGFAGVINAVASPLNAIREAMGQEALTLDVSTNVQGTRNRADQHLGAAQSGFALAGSEFSRMMSPLQSLQGVSDEQQQVIDQFAEIAGGASAYGALQEGIGAPGDGSGVNGALEAANDNIATLRESLSEFIDIEDPFTTVRENLAGLQELLAAGEISWQQYGHASAMAMASAASATLSAVGKQTSMLASAFEDNKAFALANAVVSGLEAVVSSYAAGARIGGPILGAAFAATAAAATAAQIGAIMSAKPGSASMGGSGGGGTAAAPAPVAPPEPSRTINVTLGGNGRYSRDEVRDLLEQLTGELNDGAGTKFKMAVNS